MGWFLFFISLLVMGIGYQNVHIHLDKMDKRLAEIEEQLKGHKRGL